MILSIREGGSGETVGFPEFQGEPLVPLSRFP